MASGDCSIGCNLFYELQLAISVRGECVNFVCKTFTINCNRSLSAYKCTQRQTHIQAYTLRYSLCEVYDLSGPLHCPRILNCLPGFIELFDLVVSLSCIQRLNSHATCNSPTPPSPLGHIHLVLFTAHALHLVLMYLHPFVISYVRLNIFCQNLPNSAANTRHTLSHPRTPSIHKHTHTLAGNEALTFAPSIDIYYTGYMYMHPSVSMAISSMTARCIALISSSFYLSQLSCMQIRFTCFAVVSHNLSLSLSLSHPFLLRLLSQYY